MLHTKRAIFYALVSVVVKMIVVLFVVSVPEEAYLHPDVLSEQQAAIVTLTNEVRISNHVAQLVEVPKLNVAAQDKANDMAINRYFSHRNQKGRTLEFFLKKAGYDYVTAGENLAVGFSNPKAVVEAWKKSTTHFANLVDRDFTELGVGLESGVYRGEPVVFVAQHFGRPRPNASLSGQEPAVLGIKTQQESIVADEATSFVYWLEKNGVTQLQVRVALAGTVKEAQVLVKDVAIPLQREADGKHYRGQVEVQGGAEQFFEPLVMPMLVGFDGSEKRVVIPVNWFNVKSPEITFVKAYNVAKESSAIVKDVFGVTGVIYQVLAGFFALLLVLMVVVEIRRQKYHIIAQTAVLVGLFVVLWRI